MDSSQRVFVVSLVSIALGLATTASAAPVVSHPDGPGAAPGLKCFGQPATIVGTPGRDSIVGTAGPDVIVGLGGGDRIHGRGGNDLICGGRGADVIHGDTGDDRLAGGLGADRLFGGAGTDRCEAGDKKPPNCENPGALQAHDITLTTGEVGAVTTDLLAAVANPDHRRLTFVALQTEGTRGRATLEADGRTARFDPAGAFTSLGAGETATTRFGYAVGDSRSRLTRATVTVVVDGSDNPPTAVPDSARTTEGVPLSVDPLADDTDPDGGEMKIASVTRPAHGTVSVSDDRTKVEYAPEAGYCDDGEAPDRLNYSLNGGSTATVSIAVACRTHLTVTEGLFPAFDPSVSDYVVHCDGASPQVSGRLAEGDSLTVDGGSPQTGIVAPIAVPLEEDQEFDFTLSDDEGPREYHVRCLPADFPTWEYEQFEPSRHAFYFVAPTLEIAPSISPPPTYAVIFDAHGAPVWWYSESEPGGPIGSSVLADGDVAWFRKTGSSPGSFVVRELDGDEVESVVAGHGETDPHEFQRLPNGNYLIIATHQREHVELTGFGGGADETVLENDIEEVEPGGAVAWEWSTEGHIAPEETQRWWAGLATTHEANVWDEFHMNAIEPEYDEAGELKALLVSLRHTDAIYKIDRASGEILWKLGGTTTPKSLTVLGDPQGAYPFGGQHDVRLQPDGTITLHDNNTALPDPPRAVRYSIDEAARTATLLEAITDPLVSKSGCCGSARRSADGSWLMSWGLNSLVTEFDPAGRRTFQLGFGGNMFAYRAESAPDGVFDAAALRAGMDAMHPRG